MALPNFLPRFPLKAPLALELIEIAPSHPREIAEIAEIVPTLQRGNALPDAPASRSDGARP